jgi:hypothetical protein
LEDKADGEDVLAGLLAQREVVAGAGRRIDGDAVAAVAALARDLPDIPVAGDVLGRDSLGFRFALVHLGTAQVRRRVVPVGHLDAFHYA